jgi:hypothetical protein
LLTTTDENLTIHLYKPKEGLSMSILRVVEDGVEFFTVNSTGKGAMSEIGISRICHVSQQSINELIQNTVTGNVKAECLKHLAGKDFRLQAKMDGSAIYTRLNLVCSEYVAALIEYYAFESRYKTKEALFAYRKFAKMGIDAWIQGITGWQPPAPANPKQIDLTDIRLPIDSINILTAENFSSTVYRLFLHIQSVGQQGDRPNIRKICTELKISRPTYHKHIRRLYNLGLLPDWLEVETRNYPERFVRDWLHQELGGEIEVPTPDGPIDLLTKHDIIEVKTIEHWKEAIGHIVTKRLNYPDLTPCIMLFGETKRNLDHIEQRCQALKIEVGFRPIRYRENSTTKELEVSFRDRKAA